MKSDRDLINQGFECYKFFYSLDEAKQTAKDLRLNGYYARVINEDYEYWVYRKKKENNK
jgi:hypothetical protein